MDCPENECESEPIALAILVNGIALRKANWREQGGYESRLGSVNFAPKVEGGAHEWATNSFRTDRQKKSSRVRTRAL